MQATGADGFVPVGYEQCRDCGDFAVEGTLRRGRCEACRGRLAEVAATAEVTYEVGGRTLVSRPTRARKRSRRRPRTEADRAWNRARSRALQRLATIHRPLYEVLLAQEKAKEGLDPGIMVRSPGSKAIEDQIRRAG